MFSPALFTPTGDKRSATPVARSAAELDRSTNVDATANKSLTGSPFSAAATSAAARSPFGATSKPKLSEDIFGGPSTSGSSARAPGGLAGKAPSEINEASKAQDEPWWKQITAAQIFIVLSFSTIIGIMIGTAYFVFSVGAIRLNE